MRHDGNIAFKLNWVQGKNGPFRGPCTSEGRILNIQRLKKVWCSQDECDCKQLYLAELEQGKSLPPAANQCVCYEVGAFQLKRYWGGVLHTGPRQNEPMRMLHAREGKWAFLTTRTPQSREQDRIVLACFQIAAVKFDEEWGAHAVFAKKGTWVQVAKDGVPPSFWKHHNQPAGPLWGTGLFRYLPDAQAESLRQEVLVAAGKQSS